MTLAQALAEAAAGGLARLDAQLLLLHAIGRGETDRAWLIAHDGDALAPDAAERFRQACARRASGEPVAYLLGRKEFFGLTLEVDPRVLVPRPDTETLVSWALAVLDGVAQPEVIDLGTGSGAIALALRHARPDARVTAVDGSADAVAVAAANARRLDLAIEVRQGDWLQGCTARYDLIVSNPPYVAEQDPHLAALRHEPRGALVAGTDGLADLRTIVRQAPSHLKPGGWLLLEHGWDQSAAVQALLHAAGFAQVDSRTDLAGIARCSGGRWLERG
ncbi:MAG TPA: peptide chain release factor N(5)-glutamine methyltransferase [Ramlibacter sp.]|jgi:release factor glutamine methyltransferase|uniref:peptide chain release factor N(5)-glutamine methyltransferase n=1 Tax=Ramlibacter sp. TaxID=1917967 RepID=UPI002D505BF9|nr:peptide chain release factor N(5)-glutamine methyltransferase [Ramlibacter sp.]HZY18967.1 peptide chain release factor N(5)-glutamine methyltransferase [Ramlibacter sp.]